MFEKNLTTVAPSPVLGLRRLEQEEVGAGLVEVISEDRKHVLPAEQIV